MYQVKFADIGEGLTEGTVAEVLVKIGDTVKAGQALYFVETDKVNSEIPAPIDGKIAKINISAGQEIKVGDIVMEIDDGSGAAVAATPKAEQSKAETKVEQIEENASVVGATPVSNELITRNVQSVSTTNKQIKATPLARKVAADLKVDLSSLTGTGPNGRILVADVKNAQAASVQTASQTPASEPSQAAVSMPQIIDVNAPLSW
ncbi:pyruvate dehydrogenase E2 component, partial [Mycoplasma putrefaciens]